MPISMPSAAFASEGGFDHADVVAVSVVEIKADDPIKTRRALRS